MKRNLIIVALLALMACSSDVIKEFKILELDYPDDLDIVRRAEWGWVPIDTTVNVHEVKKITIHHGGVEFKEDRDPIEHVRNLQSWSRSDKKWADIPYHYMIDLMGVIYECRPINIPGDTNTEYNPDTHALICVMGNYEVQTLSEVQLNSVVKLCAYLAKRFNVPAAEIEGHKDYSKITVCPGKDLYQYLTNGTIVNRVKKILDEG